jgi:hypothetical protein
MSNKEKSTENGDFLVLTGTDFAGLNLPIEQP